MRAGFGAASGSDGRFLTHISGNFSQERINEEFPSQAFHRLALTYNFNFNKSLISFAEQNMTSCVVLTCWISLQSGQIRKNHPACDRFLPFPHLKGAQDQVEHQPLLGLDVVRKEGKNNVVYAKEGYQQQGGFSQSPEGQKDVCKKPGFIQTAESAAGSDPGPTPTSTDGTPSSRCRGSSSSAAES